MSSKRRQTVQHRQQGSGAKLWGGRFAKPTAPLVERFTSSIAVDHRLLAYDLRQSIAHARMLGRRRIIPSADAQRLVRGLERLLIDARSGRLRIDPTAEDVHTLIQQALAARIGAAAERLQTARSRNDQVVTSLRLWAKDAIAGLRQRVRALQQALVAVARRDRTLVLPGYTHLQRAQWVLWPHVWLAYCEMLERDHQRLSQLVERVDVLPLGSVALAGTTLPVDRVAVARELGFRRISANSLDAVSDRDFVVELLAALALVSVHLSRLGEEIVLYASSEFGWLRLDEAHCTGSSYLPQKRNPDVAELVRASAGEVCGALLSVLMVLKGLPLSYNRDLQQDKRPLFRATDLVAASLEVMAGVVGGMRPNRERIAASWGDEALCATDLSEALVRRGMPATQAHRTVGRLLRHCAQTGRRLASLTARELRLFTPLLNGVVRSVLDPRRSVAAKRSSGSTSPASVARQLQAWRRRLAR